MIVLNRDAIGAVGQVFGALAVIATRLYLAIQIGQLAEKNHLASDEPCRIRWTRICDRLPGLMKPLLVLRTAVFTARLATERTGNHIETP